MHSLRVFTIAALAPLLGSVNAFWRLECQGSSGLARLDPLMAFDTVGDHVHSIKGGSAFSPTSKANDLLRSKCTSCGVAQDMSAYWAPAMYFVHDDGTTELVPEKPPHKTYYLMRSGSTHDGRKQTVEAFPNGFQMIAGNNFRRNSTIPDPDPNVLGPWPAASQDELAQRAIGFNCLHYAAGNNEPTLRRHKLPDKEFLDSHCADGLRLELQFPSCWNGDLDGGLTHNSHVRFPDGVSVGNCPKGYDRRLMTLMFETIVATDKFKGKAGQFVLANGDPTGYGYHGDFIAAWKDNTLEKALRSCDEQVPSGNMKDCAVFDLTQDSDQCKFDNQVPDIIAKEDVKGPMKGLVNGLQIAYGPGPAPKPQKSNRPKGKDSASAPSKAPKTPKVAQKKKEVVQYQEPLPSSSTFRTSRTTSTVAITPAPAPLRELKPGESILATSFSTKDNVVYEIIKIAKIVTVTREANSKRDLHLRRHLHHRHGKGGAR